MDMNVWIMITGVLTALFTGIAVIQHVIERPKPRIKLLASGKRVFEKNQLIVDIRAINVGDGDAFNAMLSTTAGDNENRETNFAARLSNDNRLEWCATIVVMTPEPYFDEESGLMVGEEWNKPIPDTNDFATVTWNQPPYLHRMHKKKIRLSDIEEA